MEITPFNLGTASDGESTMSISPLRVLIVDDHPLILEGIRRGLDRTENIEVVGEAQNASAAIAKRSTRRKRAPAST